MIFCWVKTRLIALSIALLCMASGMPEIAFGAPRQKTSADASKVEASKIGPGERPANREALDPNRKLVSIGVLAKEDIAGCAIRYKPTADYLTDKIDGYRFAIVPTRFEDFHDAVAERKVDFVFCNPLFYAQLQATSDTSAIATVREHFKDVYFSRLGGVVFWRKANRGIRGVEDIRGKSFAAVDEDSFAGWIAGEAFLLDKGIDVKKEASLFGFLGTHTGVVRAVRDGVYDFGVVKAGTLERMAKTGAIQMSDFQMAITVRPSDNFPFYSSTKLYPEWAFAKTGSVSDSLAKKVADALYEMPEKSKAARRGRYAGWTIPANYQPVWVCAQKVQRYGIGSDREATFSMWDMLGLMMVVVALLVSGGGYIVSLKRRIRAHELLIGFGDQAISAKEDVIRDLKQRIALLAGEKHENLNVIREDYRIISVTEDWEAHYGPGVGKYCYEYFNGFDEPCEDCGLREASEMQKVSVVKKSFALESGRPMEVKTIPLGRDETGKQLFGQTYSDILTQNRKASLSAISQERETAYLLLYGIVQKSEGSPGNAVETLYQMRRLIGGSEPPQRIDMNRVIQSVVKQTKHAWEHLAKVSFDSDPERPVIWAVEQDARMLVANLILNAVRCLEFGAFSDANKGRINFSTQLQGDSLILMVVDDGELQVGMTSKELFAEPGHAENSRENFIRIGLFPTYDRVFDKWNGKLQFHRTDDNRNVRTIVVPVVITERKIPPFSDKIEDLEINTAAER